MQLRERLHLDPEALVLGQVPVQHVELGQRHPVDGALDHFDRDEVAAGVDQHPAPAEARRVGDRRHLQRVAVGVHLVQLQQRLEAADRADHRVGAESVAVAVVTSSRYDSSSSSAGTAGDARSTRTINPLAGAVAPMGRGSATTIRASSRRMVRCTARSSRASRKPVIAGAEGRSPARRKPDPMVTEARHGKQRVLLGGEGRREQAREQDSGERRMDGSGLGKSRKVVMGHRS